jgi:hypothetical protein
MNDGWIMDAWRINVIWMTDGRSLNTGYIMDEYSMNDRWMVDGWMDVGWMNDE